MTQSVKLNKNTQFKEILKFLVFYGLFVIKELVYVFSLPHLREFTRTHELRFTSNLLCSLVLVK